MLNIILGGLIGGTMGIIGTIFGVILHYYLSNRGKLIFSLKNFTCNDPKFYEKKNRILIQNIKLNFVLDNIYNFPITFKNIKLIFKCLNKENYETNNLALRKIDFDSNSKCYSNGPADIINLKLKESSEFEHITFNIHLIKNDKKIIEELKNSDIFLEMTYLSKIKKFKIGEYRNGKLKQIIK